MTQRSKEEVTEAIAPSRDDASSGAASGAHPAGIHRAFVLFGVMAAAGIVPYLLPTGVLTNLGLSPEDVARLQPWNEGDPIPFTRFLNFRPPTRPTLAGVEGEAIVDFDSDDDLLASAPIPAAQDSTPIDVPSSKDKKVSLRIPPEEYRGITESLDDPQGSLTHFYRSLAQVALKRPNAMARISFWTDSINGSDRVTSHLRSRLQERFGDGGKGFVVTARGWQSQHHQDVRWEAKGGWRVRVVNRGQLDPGYYGLGGVAATNRSTRSRVTFGTTSEGPGATVSRLELFYQMFPGGGSISVAVDGSHAEDLITDSDRVADGFHVVDVPDGSHEFEVAVQTGEARLYGAALERDGPGVVVDGLMLIGAFTRVLLNWDVEHLKAQIAQRKPNLLVFWLGGNDSVSEAVPFQRTRYVADYTEVLRRMQAGRPEASCLVVSVLDSAEKIKGVVRSRRRVPRVVAAQRAAAQAAGCAFFNGYRAIGGSGAIWRWVRHRPRLVSVDYRHLTVAGARVFGTLLHRALLEGYDRWLAESGFSGQDKKP